MDVANSFPLWEGRNKGERGFSGKSVKGEVSLKEPGFLECTSNSVRKDRRCLTDVLQKAFGEE